MRHPNATTNNSTEIAVGGGHVVLLLGAGIHRAANIKRAKGKSIAERLASWEGVQEGFYAGKLLGQTLAWELNGIDNYGNPTRAAGRLKAHQKSLSEKLKSLSEQAREFDWQPPKALQTFLKSGRVTDVISLNVDLALEQWLLKAYKIKALPGVKGSDNKCRRRVFHLVSGEVNFWYPHGDISRPSSLQFSLSDYATSLKWMEGARGGFKAREKQGEPDQFKTWLDPFMSKREIVVLGASLDQAEWDIWYALLCRWRNFACHESEEWSPSTWVLSKKNEPKHRHLPRGYIELLECDTYPQAWEALENVAQGLLEDTVNPR